MPRVVLIFSKNDDEHMKFILQELHYLKNKDKANVMIFPLCGHLFSQTKL